MSLQEGGLLLMASPATEGGGGRAWIMDGELNALGRLLHEFEGGCAGGGGHLDHVDAVRCSCEVGGGSC